MSNKVLPVDFRKLCFEIKDCGINRTVPVLLHSSFKSLGPVEGGPLTVVEAFLECFDTVLFPAFTGAVTDGPECPPVMDVSGSATWAGAIPETARVRAGALRSWHPTHSLTAFGKKAAELLHGHENTASPCDGTSPFAALAGLSGKIILVGCDHNSNTMVHCCEEAAGVGYHLHDEITEGVVLTGSRKLVVPNRLHNWHKPATDFNKIVPLLDGRNAIFRTRIAAAPVQIVDAAIMYDVLGEQLRIQPEFLMVR